ncbi:coiled-coil domain-containing protein 34 isoform 1-T1 [Menidia menidia]
MGKKVVVKSVPSLLPARKDSKKGETFLTITQRNRLQMSEEKIPTFPASASEHFSSTPVKTSKGKDFHISRGLDNDIVVEDEDTFSLLSPIYHDSYESDEEVEGAGELTPPKKSYESRRCKSSLRYELPKTPSDQMLPTAVQPAGSPSLTAWQTWLLNKAKEDRLKQEKKAEEERLLREKKEEQERNEEHKKVAMEERIHEWLRVKREQERQEQLLKQRMEEEEIQRKQEKQREIEQKAQQKYRDWLQKKNQEKMEKEKQEKEAAALKEEQERLRRWRAEEKFKEWLTKANERSRCSPKSPFYSTSPYEKLNPAPSFYNPIPWKPVPIPPPETAPNKTSTKKPQKQRKSHQSSCSAFRIRDGVSAARFLQWR